MKNFDIGYGVSCANCLYEFPYGIGNNLIPVPHTNVYGKICPACHSFIPPPCEPSFVRKNKERKHFLILEVIQSIREKYRMYQGAK